MDASMDGELCVLTITSECKSIQKFAQNLQSVNPMDEISNRKGTSTVLMQGSSICPHAACPVPVGIIKAVEVESGLALPEDVTIKLLK